MSMLKAQELEVCQALIWIEIQLIPHLSVHSNELYFQELNKMGFVTISLYYIVLFNFQY